MCFAMEQILNNLVQVFMKPRPSIHDLAPVSALGGRADHGGEPVRQGRHFAGRMAGPTGRSARGVAEQCAGPHHDPIRTGGWNPWFSEWPNDVQHFTFKLHNTDDANRLIRQLAKIPRKVELKLNPGREPGALGFMSALKAMNGHAALFSLGNQKRIDEWFARLPQDEHGVRTFGIQRHTNAPVALAPTLTFYVSSGRIELEKLEIPGRVNVTADISEAARQTNANHSVIKSIDEFVARRRALR
jgi:hypothetical protein